MTKGVRRRRTSPLPVGHEVLAGNKTDLDELGIARNAREEKLAARKKEQDQHYREEMAKLYREHVLEEPGRRFRVGQGRSVNHPS